MKPPIFIFGVPRSGTTLLRTILNCHPHIACGPEAPWLAHQGASVMAFSREITQGEFSFSRNFGVPPEQVLLRVREFVDHLFSDFARLQGKTRWAHKTPDDCLFVDFFVRLFPEARYIHIVRHPLDVALSTVRVAEHRKGVSDWHEKNLVLEEGTAIPNTLFAAVLRWRRWNEKIRRGLAAAPRLEVRYEELVRQPVESFRRLFTFLDEPFDPAILDYRQFASIFPDWEWGSADVRRAQGINTRSLDRWRKELAPAQAAALAALAGGEFFSRPASGGGVAGKEFLAEAVDTLAAGLRLVPLAAEDNVAFAECWLRDLHRQDWTRARVAVLGGGFSVLPWLLALLGADVTVIEGGADAAGPHDDLAARLKVAAHRLPPSDRFPADDATVDLIVASADDASAADPARLREMERALKPGGFLLVFRAIPRKVGEAADLRPSQNQPGGGARLWTKVEAQ